MLFRSRCTLQSAFRNEFLPALYYYFKIYKIDVSITMLGNQLVRR